MDLRTVSASNAGVWCRAVIVCCRSCSASPEHVIPGNLLCKYAEDTYIIIPASNSHTRLAEIEHIESWSKDNNSLSFNRSKNVEVIFVDKKRKRENSITATTYHFWYIILPLLKFLE